MILLDIFLIYLAIVSANSLIYDLNFLILLKMIFINMIHLYLCLLIFFFTGQYKGITKYVEIAHLFS